MEIPAFAPAFPTPPPRARSLFPVLKSTRRGPGAALSRSKPPSWRSLWKAQRPRFCHGGLLCQLKSGVRRGRDQMGRGTSAHAALLLLVAILTSEAFEIEDIAPGHKVAAQIGQMLVLRCRTTGCISPNFSWRTHLDSPLGGIMSTQGPNSFLTVESVGFENEYTYFCNAHCGEEKREKRVQINIYSFPSDPVIEVSSPLVLGKPASITCRVPKVFPSEQLVLSLKKGDEVLPIGQCCDESHSSSVQTKTVNVNFTPTKEDIGKEITCLAELPIEDMEFEPKERKTTHVLNVNFGPLNTRITAFPATTLSEGEALTLSCETESHPPTTIVWKKQLADGTVQFIEESYNLHIPHTQFSSSGIYICEATNNVTKEVENRTVSVTIQGPPVHPELSIFPSTSVREGEHVTLQCSVKSSPPADILIMKKSATEDAVLESQDGFVHIPRVAPTDAGDYKCQVKNEFGEAQMTRALHVEYGPRNTTIVVSPSNIVKEGDTVIMICSTDGSPTPKVSWKKRLPNGGSRLVSGDGTLTLEKVQAEDMGHYECEGSNHAGKDNKAVELVVEVFSPTTPALTDAPEIFTEVEDFTTETTAYNTPHQEADRHGQMENETSATPEDTAFTTYTTMKYDTVTYVVTSSDNDENGTEEIEIIIARMEEPNYVTPIIIAIAALATAAGPVAAILIYISRKAKINGSYSLVNSLKAKV
ncbi:vascular cell adhesion protein 1 [Pogona vitticeps]